MSREQERIRRKLENNPVMECNKNSNEKPLSDGSGSGYGKAAVRVVFHNNEIYLSVLPIFPQACFFQNGDI